MTLDGNGNVRSRSTHYDLASRGTSYRDALNQTTTYTYDALDRQR
jgi:hypothetical protein